MSTTILLLEHWVPIPQTETFISDRNSADESQPPLEQVVTKTSVVATAPENLS